MPTKGSTVPWKPKETRKLSYGVGTNDADYQVIVWDWEYAQDGSKRKQKLKWICPQYRLWKNMLKRCFGNFDETYSSVTVCDEWLLFSNFRKWVLLQDWEGQALDKDLLSGSEGKIYSPETCVFLEDGLNKFISTNLKKRVGMKTGCYYNKLRHCYQAYCTNPRTRKAEYLGLYDCPEAAHEAWRKRKHEHALWYASQETDERIIKALTERYKPNSEYLQWLNRGA